jgi:hypothetical protein
MCIVGTLAGWARHVSDLHKAFECAQQLQRFDVCLSSSGVVVVLS